MDDERRTTPRVWHKLPTGELKRKIQKKVDTDTLLHFSNIVFLKMEPINQPPHEAGHAGQSIFTSHTVVLKDGQKLDNGIEVT